MTDLQQQLHALGLRATASALNDILAQATRSRLAPQALIEQIVRTESIDRSRRSLERRMLHSRLGAFKPLADFDWSWPRDIDRPLIEAALTLDFIREGRNLVLLGGNGVGKTMISKNIAHAAILAGFSALFRSASELLDDLQLVSPETRKRRIGSYLQPHLLVIDEVGYLSYDDHAADLLYKVINPRYEKRRSILITTNLEFKEWNTVFPHATCIRTLIDRLTHHADATVIDAESYRVRESEINAAKRRNTNRAKTK